MASYVGGMGLTVNWGGRAGQRSPSPRRFSYGVCMACLEHAILMQWRTFKSKMFRTMFIASFASVRVGAESLCANSSWRRLVKSCPTRSSRGGFKAGPECVSRARLVRC